MARNQASRAEGADVRTFFAAGMLFAALCAGAFGQQQSFDVSVPSDPPADVFAEVMHQALGVPARVELADQAALRLSYDLLFIPMPVAQKLLQSQDREVPPDMLGVLLGGESASLSGPVRYVPAGFIDADTALEWTPDDILDSLRTTVTRRNQTREQQGLAPLEVRGWVQPPHYDPETHQLVWAPLIVRAGAPANSDGEVVYNAVAFGMNGYVRLAVSSTVENAQAAEQLTARFLSGLSFRAGAGYVDVLVNHPRIANGLAQAMDIDSLHKAGSDVATAFADTVVPLAGAAVASIGALSLLIHVLRRMRREARRG